VKIWQAVALLMIAIGLGAAQDRLAETLRKGVVEEEKNQNLNAAIQAYQSILSQFDQDRPTAATALFRLAECYRKQGKSDLAIAAYKRVASEFQDQTKLAEQSRTVLAQTYGAQPAQAARPAAPKKANPTGVADARRRYIELTLAQIKEVRSQLASEQRNVELGTGSMGSILQVQSRLAGLERQLFVIDAPPGEASAAAARRAFRANLEDQIQMTEARLKAAQNEFNLGAVEQSSVTDARVRLLDLQRQLAAFEAGILQPSTAPPVR
jgi:lipopolysaccharide biosynthesis regulator YciM